MKLKPVRKSKDDDETVLLLMPKPKMKSAFVSKVISNRQPCKPISANRENTSNLFTHIRHKNLLLFVQVDEKRNHEKTGGKGGKVLGSSRSGDQPMIESAYALS